MRERTPEEFVDDMLSKGRDWMAILSVSRAIRGGKWAPEVQSILKERNLMPDDNEKARKMMDMAIKIKKDEESAVLAAKKKRCKQHTAP